MYSQELYELMESEYRKRGASNNSAQLIMRENHLKFMLQHHSENKIKDMILNDFDTYHRYQASH